MSRTGEIVLGVISSVFTVTAIILMSLFVIGGNAAFQDELFTTGVQQEILNNPTFIGQDVELAIENLNAFTDIFSVLGWGLVAALVISLILNIIGIVAVVKNRNPKLAGIMFIAAGLFAWVISLTSILLYIAAIMCFVRKPPVKFAEQEYYAPEQTM